MQADAPEGIPVPERGRRTGRPTRGPRTSTGPSLLAPGAAHDPYRIYRVLREEYPLSYDAPLGAWLVSRYADVTTALTDPRFTGLPHDTAPRGGPAPLGLCHGSPRCAPRTQHPAAGPGAVPRHMSDPGPVTRHMPDLASVPRHMAARIERTAYVLARRIASRQQADLVEEFCRWLPVGAAPDASARPHRHPGTGTGTTATPCTRHTGLRERALASLLANVLDAPDLLAALRIEPALADRAWTESLRRDPPVQVVLRRTVTEVALSGGTLPAGADVACLIGSAGRDPERFAAPDLFDPFRRDQGRSLSGPVSCPAVLLGRLEARHGLRALLDAMPRLRWADGFRPAGTGLLTRGPRALLVRPG
ncbi:cytochrome P450 [Streptomyces sp. NBC_01591]|uniref:cytochrome P450 n=1 Tax=Streptomyces sp. NBC_01591 TaxID=2975888 RepID=UPI002DDACA1B|nr:cytochrome P450 [Streptomyces sp. NBC_01591]WSD71550.1 cytochrome P450 [Streptomyces sp. NBC_01591]